MRTSRIGLPFGLGARHKANEHEDPRTSQIELPFGLGARYKYDERDYRYSDEPLALTAWVDSPVVVDNSKTVFANVPVWNQGKQGACVGMSLAAGMSVLFGKVLSPRDAFERAKRYDEWPGENYDGSSVRGGCKAGQKEGCCEYDKYPFIPFVTAGKAADADANAALHKLLRYERLNSDVEIKHAIYTHGFCIATVDVHTGWIKPTKDHRIRYDPRFIRRGLHAVVLVGYNDDTKHYRLRNSWRNTWADGGYADMSYKDWEANGYDAWAIFRTD